MLEHMMFKGTKNFGSTDYQKDAALQARIDAAYSVVKAEQAKRSPDANVIREKRTEMEQLRLDAQKLYIPEVFSSSSARTARSASTPSPPRTRPSSSLPCPPT